MQSLLMRIFLVLVILHLFNPSLTSAAAEQRIALVIGNSAYGSGPLKNPVNDAADMAAALQKLGFKVVLKRNANLETMEEAIADFGNKLKRGGVGLFYYAGHGVQMNGINYLIPVNAKINKESDVRYRAIDAGQILDEMANANNGMNIVVLDACRDNPFGKSFRSASRGLAIVSNSPSGSFISYSTSPGYVARDGEGRNSPYTRALLDNMVKPGLTLNKVFMNVRSKVKKETGQIPWELSSLEGDFYFVPGSDKTAMDPGAPAEPLPEKDVSGISTKDASDERGKIQMEKQRLEKEEAHRKEKTALEEKQRELEEKKKQLALRTRPSVNGVNDIKRDGRFIAYSNGTVLDTQTNLMWAAKDSGKDISWTHARAYCENYRGGGYQDWRMPTKEELTGLYDPGKSRPAACYASDKIHVATELIDLTCFAPWASDTRGSDAIPLFGVFTGSRGWGAQTHDGLSRALPVRLAK